MLLECWLPAPYCNLCVSGASHGSLIDVSTANNDVGIINNHHLAVDIDHLSHGLSEHLTQCTGCGRVQHVNVRTIYFSLARTEEHEPVSGVLTQVRGNIGLSQ